jgi:hypothetical protein
LDIVQASKIAKMALTDKAGEVKKVDHQADGGGVAFLGPNISSNVVAEAGSGAAFPELSTSWTRISWCAMAPPSSKSELVMALCGLKMEMRVA